MITKLVAIDFDDTLSNSPHPEEGKEIWKEKTGQEFPYTGWWSKPESLDTNVFNITMFENIKSILTKEGNSPDTYVVILTSRLERLRPQIQAILDVNNVHVDRLDMRADEKQTEKGEKILKYISEFPDLEEIDVYDDKESNILSYKQIEDKIPSTITFQIFYSNNGNVRLMEASDKIIDIIDEEIQNFINEKNYVYHGTYDGAGHSIQRDGKMKINAANNNEPFISFTSKPNTAKYYADMKGGSIRGIVLRTKLTDNFQSSPKYKKNDGYEWITLKEIPIDELEINTEYGWIPLNDWDFIDKKVKL